jgi:cellulose biosynthesis protein BcsQ
LRCPRAASARRRPRSGWALTLGREPRLGTVLLVDADPQASATTSRAALVHRQNHHTRAAATARGDDPDAVPPATFATIYPFAQCQLSFPSTGELARADVARQLEGITHGHYAPVRPPGANGPSTPAADVEPALPAVVVVDTSPAYPAILSGVLDFLARQPRALLVVPPTMSDFDIPQARQFSDILHRSTAANVRYALLATKFDRRRRADGERLNGLRLVYPVFNTIVPYGAPFARGPFDDFDRPKSPYGRIYKSVTAEAVEMLTGRWQPTPTDAVANADAQTETESAAQVEVAHA